jgi:predicted XRE-type DNA-binding protein
MKKTSREKVRVKEASHNIFADFGITDATEKNAKVQLAVAINEIIGRRHLSQKHAAELMNCTQPEVSSLTNYKLTIFSIERLIDFLLALDNDVEITIRPKHDAKRAAKTTVKLKHPAA